MGLCLPVILMSTESDNPPPLETTYDSDSEEDVGVVEAKPVVEAVEIELTEEEVDS